MASIFELQVQTLEKELSKTELAKALITTREVSEVFKKDNDELRKENKRLRYIIAKYNMNDTKIDVLNDPRD